MLLLNYWKTMGNPVVRESALSPQKILICLNPYLKPNHLLEHENLLILVYNAIWNFIGPIFYKNLWQVWVRR